MKVTLRIDHDGSVVVCIDERCRIVPETVTRVELISALQAALQELIDEVKP